MVHTGKWYKGDMVLYKTEKENKTKCKNVKYENDENKNKHI